MFRPDRGTLRSAGFVLLLTGVFVMVNSQVVYAASSDSETGDLLAPLNITSSEGVPINGYELNSEGGSIVAFKTQSLAFALSGLFTFIRLLVGLAGWAIEVAFRFPLLKILIRPAQKVADAYDNVVVDTLGLKGLLLAWAFVFAGFMIVRGRVGRGLGEIFLTLLIAAFAASAFVRPDYLLTQDGPLGQSQQVAAEVAQQSVNSYDWGGKLASRGPCDGMAGMQEVKCQEREVEAPVSSTDVARPIQDSVTNALIVKPYMLLQYGRILDPAKEADRKAYAVHLKWITGGYEEEKKKDDKCDLVRGPLRDYCNNGDENPKHPGELPPLTAGEALLESGTSAVLSKEDQQFAAFLNDLEDAGPVGKACAEYAKTPTWWRVGGAVLLLIAALFICGMLLSSAIVMLGTQGICAAAAAAGGVTFIAAMLPGPPRQSVWKWLSVWGIAVLTLVGVCAFVPFFGIAVDATITNGPDLMVERILLIDVLAIAGAAGHRRLLTGITSFGRRMAMRMRYAKVGGTHMPGDTSELGAALAMNSPAAMGGYGGGLRAFTGGGGGRFGLLGTRQRLMGALTSLVDGAGMPVDTGAMLAYATAEAGRGLAPLTAAAAVGGLGARLGVKGAGWLLIGKRPDREELAKWRKPAADGDPPTGGPRDDGPNGSGGGGPRRPGGPPDRYRNDDGQVVDRNTGQVLHDQNTDRTLLSTRAHNRLVRFRGYRILNRGGRAAYGSTVGLPANVRRARSGGSDYSQDVRQQVRVWGNTIREDGRAWGETGRHVSRVLRENTDDSGGPGPFVSHRLPTRTAPPQPPPHSSSSTGPTSHSSPRSSAPTSTPSAPPTSPPRLGGGAPRRPAGPAPTRSGPVLPGGGGASSSTRDEARARFQELMRRTAPRAERRREEWEWDSWPPEDGEDE
ncbi:hypothetical protein FBY35_0019 [Streptomyces sp. SLBN-118]|uniref:hypothetical protein n=1 Tax=Streptomyces sp. SLBN-118 TaxID=2768454 RepID=UPI001153505B|nr:hypothetical protein [Streptomyces sp. SLBN-118]TQK49757.1 hypothetical protein FBY35_0019 [Streptomyces sp. SLBN-118]